MNTSKPWPHLINRDAVTGIPEMPMPLLVKEHHYFTRHIGSHSKPPDDALTVVEVRSWGICSQHGRKALDTQFEFAREILASMKFGSPWFPEVSYSRVEYSEESVEAVFIDAVISIPDYELEKLPYGLDSELIYALRPGWVAWNLADPGVSVPFNNRTRLMTRTAELICSGIEWRAALSLAEVEIAQG